MTSSFRVRGWSPNLILILTLAYRSTRRKKINALKFHILVLSCFSIYVFGCSSPRGTVLTLPVIAVTLAKSYKMVTSTCLFLTTLFLSWYLIPCFLNSFQISVCFWRELFWSEFVNLVIKGPRVLKGWTFFFAEHLKVLFIGFQVMSCVYFFGIDYCLFIEQHIKLVSFGCPSLVCKSFGRTYTSDYIFPQ